MQRTHDREAVQLRGRAPLSGSELRRAVNALNRDDPYQYCSPLYRSYTRSSHSTRDASERWQPQCIPQVAHTNGREAVQLRGRAALSGSEVRRAVLPLAYICTYMHIYMFICIYVYMYIYVYINIYR